MGRTRGDHGSVALEQRLQGCPASPTVPGGACTGLHSGVLPMATGGFQLTWQSEKWLELSLTRRAIALLSTVLSSASAAGRNASLVHLIKLLIALRDGSALTA